MTKSFNNCYFTVSLIGSGFSYTRLFLNRTSSTVVKLNIDIGLLFKFLHSRMARKKHEHAMQDKIQKAAEILSKINVPTIPEEVLKLKEELNKKFPNTVTVANLISHNPELLSDFLTLVNTNITSEDSEIKDAKAAVNLLGLDEIYNIFLSASLSNLITQNATEKEILLNGAQAGLVAAELSYWVYDVTRYEAYMAGLMQNIGAVFMARKYSDDYLELYQAQLGNPITAYDKELETYGTTHCYLGVLVTKKWHVDPDVYKSIIFHHDLDFAIHAENHQRVKHLTALTMIANYIVSSTTGEQYITQELKDYRIQATKAIDLPENAFKAAVSILQKFGKKMGLVAGSH